MAREIFSPSAIRQPGTYGPFSIDSFTKDDADSVYIEATVESWPAVERVAIITITLEDGSRAAINVPGEPKNKDGSPNLLFRCGIMFPSDGSRGQPMVKRDIRSANASIEVLEQIRTALTVRAE